MHTEKPQGTPPQDVELIIDSLLQNVSLVGVAVNSMSMSLSLSQVDASQIELCVVEAVTNAIKHAYNNQPGFSVQVSFEVHPDKLMITVCDEGEAMPALVVPSLDFDPTDLEHLPVGGMGLFLIHSIMDEVTYVSQAGKNRLIMTKRLPPRGEDASC
jgi:serine/threonine-protein kinase RsbW